MDPALDMLALPRFSDMTPAAIAPALDAALAAHRATVQALTATRPTDFAAAWLPYERATVALDALWSTVSHLHGVADARRAPHPARARSPRGSCR